LALLSVEYARYVYFPKEFGSSEIQEVRVASQGQAYEEVLKEFDVSMTL
jgi:hypothetical protein